MSLSKSKILTFLMLLYLYINPIASIFSPLLDRFYFEIILMIAILIICFIFSVENFSKKALGIYSLILILTLLNIFFTNYNQYVLPDAFNLLLTSIIPLIVIPMPNNENKHFVKIYYIFSLSFTLLLPYLYSLRMNGYISYFDLGFATHLNIIGFSLNIIYGKKQIFDIILIIINFFVGMIFGSRGLLLASLGVIIYLIIHHIKGRKLQNYLGQFILIVSLLLIFFYIDEIIIWLLGIVNNLGINSRNLSLFALQITGNSEIDFFSGRESIYPVVINYLKENPLLPNGLAGGRILSGGQYYHVHSFILEMLLIFGVPIGLILILLFVFKIFNVNRRKNEFTNIINLFFISFFIRSLVGTHFISDQMFWLLIAFIIQAESITLEE